MTTYILNRESLKQTSLSCPSAWSGLLTDATPVEIRFRTGVLKFLVNGKEHLSTSRDEFDISSYISLEDALKLLQNSGIESDK